MWWTSCGVRSFVCLLWLGGVVSQATVACAQVDRELEAAQPANESAEVKTAQDLLQGTWISIRHRRNGEPSEQAKRTRLVVQGDRYELDDGEARLDGQYRIDVTATPKRIILSTRAGVLHASYALEEGELKLCFGPQPIVSAPEGVETASGDGRLLTVFAPQLVRVFEGHKGPLRTAAFSPDGRLIASGSGWPKGDGTIRLWDVESGKEIRRIAVPSFVSDSIDRGPNRRAGDVGQLAFTPDGRQIIACGIGGFVIMWNVDTGELTRRFEGAGDFVCSLAVSPDGRLVLAGGRANRIVVWEVASGRRLRQFGKHDRQIRSLALSPDGQTVLSGGHDDTMRLWDLESGKELHRFELDGTPFSLSFSPDGRQAVAAISAQTAVHPVSPICIWDLETTELVRRIEAHPHGVTCAVFSGDGRRILSSGYDCQVRLWDAQSGSPLGHFQGHRNWIRSVAFSPDGRFALSAGGGQGNAENMQPGEDFGIRLWNLALAVDDDAGAGN